MFFPVGDDNRDRTITPFINYLIIVTNILVFIFLQDFGNNDEFTYEYSMVPEEIVSGKDVVTQDRIQTDPISGEKVRVPGLLQTPIPVYLTIFTSMFMHGGLAHIFGNMLFLFIFGDNIENKIGHFRYLVFYLIAGALASIAQIFTIILLDGNLLIPTLGASGAISGVLGAYMLLFPRRRVRVLFLYFLTEVPAIMAIGLWFAFQIIEGMGMLGGEALDSGVAYGAHIGGFIAGLIMIKLFVPARAKL